MARRQGPPPRPFPHDVARSIAESLSQDEDLGAEYEQLADEWGAATAALYEFINSRVPHQLSDEWDLPDGVSEIDNARRELYHEEQPYTPRGGGSVPMREARRPAAPRITLEDIYNAPMWTTFHGKPAGKVIAKKYWELFDVGSNMTQEAIDALYERGFEFGTNFEEPELDDEAVYGTELEGKGDSLAWLAFLASGGTLLKVPDNPDPEHPNYRYYRLIAVEPA